MKPETLEAIKKEAELSSVKKYPVDLCEEKGYPIKIGEDFNEYDRDLFKRGFIDGATKYAELLESEREKSEKLAECLERALVDLQKNIIPLMDSLALHPPTLMEKDIEKALTEYKTTSK